MKQHVSRLPPHPNAKVFAVLMAVLSLVVLIPLGVLVSAFTPASQMPPLWTLLALPLLYLVTGYIGTVVGCAVYNLVARWTGGFVFETTPHEAG